MPMRPWAVLLAGGVFLGAAAVSLIAQTSAQGDPTFDVVSVKPVNMPVPYAAGSTGFLPGGRYVQSYRWWGMGFDMSTSIGRWSCCVIHN